MTRIALVLGAGGALGRALRGALDERGWSVVGLDRTACDITADAAIAEALATAGPSRVFNCAAYTSVDGAESDRDRAMLVNTVAPGRLARRCAQAGVGLVHYSTDFVFDGETDRPYVESDAPQPINVYGATKLAGEREVLEAHPAALVIRTAWLYGAGGRNFPSTLRERLLAGERIACERSRTGSPTWTGCLAALTVTAAERGIAGVLHGACTEPTTWWSFAERMARRLGQPPCALAPFDDAGQTRAAARPRYTALASERLGDLGLSMPSWDEAQAAYLATF